MKDSGLTFCHPLQRVCPEPHSPAVFPLRASFPNSLVLTFLVRPAYFFSALLCLLRTGYLCRLSRNLWIEARSASGMVFGGGLCGQVWKRTEGGALRMGLMSSQEEEGARGPCLAPCADQLEEAPCKPGRGPLQSNSTIITHFGSRRRSRGPQPGPFSNEGFHVTRWAEMRICVLGFLTESDLNGSVGEIDPPYKPSQICNL